MTSVGPSRFSTRPWTPVALVCFLWGQVGLSWGWLRKGFPLRPPDWESAGVRGANPELSEAYEHWYHSSLRSIVQMVAEFPGVVLMMVALLVMLTGSFGTAGFGIPALFFPDKPTIVLSWEWSWVVEQLFTGMIAGWLLFMLCFACHLLASREGLKWRGPLSTTEVDDPGQPHRVNQYLSATWSVVLAVLLVVVLLGAASGSDAHTWLRTGIFLVGAYLGGAGGWWVLLRLIRWQRRQGGPFAWLRRWCTSLTLSYRRLREARPLHPDVESAHAIGTLLVAGLVLCWVAGFFWPDAFGRLPTAAFLCLLLGLIAAVYAFFQFHGFSSTLVKPVLVVAALWTFKALAGWPVEHEFESLKYDRLFTYEEIEDNIKKAKSAPEGLKIGEVIKAWRSSTPRPGPDGARPRLVVVSTSGGAIRSATWTTRVFVQLDQSIPGFHRHVRLVTGASGGMVGAAYCVAELADVEEGLARPIGERGDELFDHIAADSLQDAVRWYILRDVPQIMLRPVLGRVEYFNRDRGMAMEKRWRTSTNGKLGYTFGRLRPLEAQGRIPSLLFSPMIVEDGRRLLVSNLDLADLVAVQVGDAGLPPSLTAWEFSACFPKQLAEIQLSAAARMSASFPFVSPAGQLPTNPPVRVVDAAYFDNYGVNLAASWLWKHSGELKDLEVILVQIRGTLETQARSSRADALQLTKGLTFHGVTTPFEGFATSNLTAAGYNNDLHLANLREHLQERGIGLHVITFDFPGPSTLSWHLSTQEKEALRGGFGEPDESYVSSFPSHQQQWVRETFQRNVTQMDALKKLMKAQP
jgi:hypothetical protein